MRDRQLAAAIAIVAVTPMPPVAWITLVVLNAMQHSTA